MIRICPVVRAAALLVVGAFTCMQGRAASAATVLPDSAVLARVDDRVTRVYDYRERYFSSDAQSRPSVDSLGRVEFLNSIVDRDVMSLEAVASRRQPDAHDELLLHRYENQLLAFGMFKRRVQDPVVVTEKELRELHAAESYQLKLRYLLMSSRASAELVRDQLLRGQITWANAARRFSLGPDSLAEGDMGWVTRSELAGKPVAKIFELRPPKISEVLKDPDGYKIWQCLDRRPTQLPAFIAIRRSLLSDLRAAREIPLEAAFFDEMRARAKPKYDTANVAWLTERFRLANETLGSSDSSGLDLRSRIPRLTEADTSRVLATARREKYTAGRVIEAYRDIHPMRRHRITTQDALFEMLERMVLEPVIVEYAREEGLNRAPDFVAEMQKKRESVLVDHLYEDSVQARIVVTQEMRRKYYQDHQREFMSREHVRYAVIPRVTEAGADSVIARLKAGTSPQAILAADSAAGLRRGAIRDLLEGQQHNYQKLLFEELRTGGADKMYLGRDKVWAVFYILAHDSPRPMAFEEVVDIVDQSLENIAAEQLLDDLLGRLRQHHRIELHPERVMQVLLADPAGDWSVPSGD